MSLRIHYSRGSKWGWPSTDERTWSFGRVVDLGSPLKTEPDTLLVPSSSHTTFASRTLGSGPNPLVTVTIRRQGRSPGGYCNTPRVGLARAERPRRYG